MTVAIANTSQVLRLQAGQGQHPPAIPHFQDDLPVRARADEPVMISDGEDTLPLSGLQELEFEFITPGLRRFVSDRLGVARAPPPLILDFSMESLNNPSGTSQFMTIVSTAMSSAPFKALYPLRIRDPSSPAVDVGGPIRGVLYKAMEYYFTWAVDLGRGEPFLKDLGQDFFTEEGKRNLESFGVLLEIALVNHRSVPLHMIGQNTIRAIVSPTPLYFPLDLAGEYAKAMEQILLFPMLSSHSDDCLDELMRITGCLKDAPESVPTEVCSTASFRAMYSLLF